MNDEKTGSQDEKRNHESSGGEPVAIPISSKARAIELGIPIERTIFFGVPQPVPEPARKKTPRKRRRGKLFYSFHPVNGGVVFAPAAHALRVARLQDALHWSLDWRDFKEAIPRKEYSRILVEGFDDDGKPRPKLDDPFDPEQVPGVLDNCYPEWLQASMDKYLPAGFLERFATNQCTLLDGPFFDISGDNLEAACAALEELGWEVECGDGLEFW